jgi:hypothetical protein
MGAGWFRRTWLERRGRKSRAPLWPPFPIACSRFHPDESPQFYRPCAGWPCALCLPPKAYRGARKHFYTAPESFQISGRRVPPPFACGQHFLLWVTISPASRATYTETWMSGSQWRREILIRNMRSLDVGGPDKHWLLFPDAFPAQADRLPILMAYLPPDDLELTFASVSEHISGDVSADCAVSKPLSGDSRFAFCFEKKSGALLEKTFPEKRPRNLVNFSCEYGKFLKFGGYRFPREVACFEDRHSTISANVVDLSLEPPMDPALFDPPTGSIELGRCSGKAIPLTITGSSVALPAPNMDRAS